MRYTRFPALTLMLVLTACGRDPNPPDDAVRPAPRKAQSAPKRGPTVESQTAGMVTAVTLGKSTVPIDLKFALENRPALARPLAIEFALLPKIAADLVTLQTVDPDGFDLPDGGGQFEMPEVVPGVAYPGSLTVTPSKRGIVVVNLNLSVKHDEIVETRSFSVPILVPEK
jgi:hypothetical protein